MHHFTIIWGMLLPVSGNTLALFPLGASLVWLGIWILSLSPSFLADRRRLTRPRVFWGGLLLWIFSLTVFNGLACKLVVFTGDAGAHVALDGHDVRLKAGELAIFTVIRPVISQHAEIDFVTESQSGLRLREKLGQWLYAAELSDHGTLRWSELVYDVPYVPRSNYVRSGSVRGALCAISGDAEDGIVPDGQKAPVVSERRNGKTRERYFSVSAMMRQDE